MQTPEEKLRLIREQVIAKIRWGATRDEVADWLGKQHGLVGDSAEPLLDAALRLRRAAIRDQAMLRVAFASAGLIAVAAFLYIRFFDGVVFSGTSGMLLIAFIIALALVSITTLVRSLTLLAAGDTDGAVD